MLQDAQMWAEENFRGTPFTDGRLWQRAVQIAARRAARPEDSFTPAVRSEPEYHGLERLFGNAAATLDVVSGGHWAHTREAARQRPITLLLQDVTEVDETAYQQTMTGLGPIGDGRGRGALAHTTLAVDPATHAVLGVAHQQMIVRVPVPVGTRRRARPKAERESRVWGVGIRAIGRPPTGVRWVLDADRTTDHNSVLAACAEQGWDFLIRAAQNRELVTTDGTRVGHLFDTVRAWPALPDTQYTVAVAAKKKPNQQQARTATLSVSFGAVRLLQSGQMGESGREGWVVRAWDAAPPPGISGLEWVLLTSVAVETVADALERLAWYHLRWMIEDYHQCLKTGCPVERRDLRGLDRGARLLGFFGPIAARLLALREVARAAGDLPALTVVEPLYVHLLARELRYPVTTLTVAGFYRGVARLGGFRAGPPAEPGWKPLWRGWLDLEAMAHGARLMDATVPLSPTPLPLGG